MAMVLQKTRLKVTQAIYFGKPPGTGGVISVGGGNGIATTPNPILGVGNVDLGPLTADWDGGNFNVINRNSRQRFNVEAYGAVLDGVTDSTAAFVAAIAAAGSEGGEVYIRATVGGGLRFTAGVTIPKNVSLIGDPGVAATAGLASSKLIADLLGTSITFTGGAPTNFFSVVQDIDIRKGASNPATHFLLNNAWFVYFNRIYTQGGSSEVFKTTNGCAHLMFENILTQSSPNVGIRFGAGGANDSANAIVLRGNELAGTAGGIIINTVLSSIASYSDVIEGCGAAGIRIEGYAGGGENLLAVHNGYFELNAGYDIDINPSGAAIAGSPVVVDISGGHYSGNAVSPGAVRMNAQCTSLRINGITSLSHTAASVVIGSTANAKIEIGPTNVFQEATKISSTPAISGSTLVSYPGTADGYVIDGGSIALAKPLTVQSTNVSGPIITLNNYDATSRRSEIHFNRAGTTYWSVRTDPPGSGSQQFNIFDALNGLTPLAITGTASGGFVGVGNAGFPTRALDVNGVQRYRGQAPPTVSEANSGTIYFDSATNKLMASLNGSAYVPVIGSGGVTGSGAANKITYWDGTTSINQASGINVDATGTGLGLSVAAGSAASVIQLNVSKGIGIGANESIYSGGNLTLQATTGATTVVGTLQPNNNGSGCTAVGGAALRDNTVDNNTAVGNGALLTTNTGTDNTAIGLGAGATNTTGAQNVLVGSGADVNAGNLNNAVAIGYQAVVGASDSMVLGNASMKVGIGTSTPKTALDVDGAVCTRHKDIALVNGLNSDIALSDTSFVRITGPTGGFSVGGFTNGTDGRILRLFNTTAQQMTIVNLDAGSAVGNKITTLTGGDVVLAARTSFATFIYEDVSDTWILTATN